MGTELCLTEWNTGSTLHSEHFSVEVFFLVSSIWRRLTSNYTYLKEQITDFLVKFRSPSAVIYKTEEVAIKAPFIASFSSRGPNPGSEQLLKVLNYGGSTSLIPNYEAKYLIYGT